MKMPKNVGLSKSISREKVIEPSIANNEKNIECPPLKIYRMSLISAGSISLDSTFKTRRTVSHVVCHVCRLVEQCRARYRQSSLNGNERHPRFGLANIYSRKQKLKRFGDVFEVRHVLRVLSLEFLYSKIHIYKRF
jgi:hypothetical protein